MTRSGLTRVQAAGQGQRPADELDVPAEMEVVRVGERVDERLEHHADVIARDERVDFRAHELAVTRRPCRMIGVDVEDVLARHHLAVRQDAVLPHLVLHLLRL